MGTSNPPLQPNNLEAILNSYNVLIDSSPNNNGVIINSINMVVNGQEIKFQRVHSSNLEEMQMENKKEGNKEPIYITLFIKSEFGKMQLQVNLNDKVRDVIEKYKNKLQKNNIQNISFYSEDNNIIEPNNTLKDYHLRNNSVINAKIQYNQTVNTNSSNQISMNPNKDQLKGIYKNREIPPEELIKIKDTIKQNYMKGLITVVIRNSLSETRFFYARPDSRFKIIEEEYKKLFPGQSWIFLFNGLNIDSEKTLKELNIKMLSVIVANEFD